MSFINAALRTLFDLLLLPFRSLSPIVGLAVVALITAPIMLIVVKKTTNQKAIAAAKNRIYAALFEIVLFNDDLRAILSGLAQVFRHNLSYLRYSLPSILWMIIPFVLMVAQLQFHYGYRGLALGEPVLLKVRLAKSWNAGANGQKPQVVLTLPDGLRAETPSLWIPSARELDWRIAGVAEGSYIAELSVGGKSYQKTVEVTDSIVRRSPIRHAGRFWDEVLYPAEAALPSGSPIESIALGYPETDIWFFGFDTHWLIAFIALSIVFAFALKGKFGVTL